MNPRSIGLIAVDVLREALYSKYLIVLFGLILLGLTALGLSLDLEVVDGALAAGKLFGMGIIDGKPMMAKELLAPLFQAMTFLVFYLGQVFLVVAVADIAPKMFAPGRVELLLSLPLRRTELVLGTYLGVMIIALMAATLAVGGGALVLFVKAEMFTWAPIAGACTAMLGFMVLYALMLLVAVVARSAALSAGAAFLLYTGAIATSDRKLLLTLLKPGVTREIVGVLVGPLPRFRVLVESAGDFTVGIAVRWAEVLPVIGGCVAFAAFCVVVACVVVQVKDY